MPANRTNPIITIGLKSPKEDFTIIRDVLQGWMSNVQGLDLPPEGEHKKVRVQAFLNMLTAQIMTPITQKKD